MLPGRDGGAVTGLQPRPYVPGPEHQLPLSSGSGVSTKGPSQLGVNQESNLIEVIHTNT